MNLLERFWLCLLLALLTSVPIGEAFGPDAKLAAQFVATAALWQLTPRMLRWLMGE